MKLSLPKGRRGALFSLLFFNFLLLSLSLCYLFVMHIYDSVASEPFCSFQKTFHLYCPGCGGSRALRYLLTLRLPSAAIAYPPIFVGVGVILYAEVLLVRGVILSDPLYIKRFKLPALIAPAAAAIIFFFIRNALLFAGIDFLGDIL